MAFARSLEGAFCKAFALVFEKGTGVIEKSYRREELEKDHAVRDYAVRLKGDRRSLRQLRGEAQGGNARNLLLTTAEGMGLGLLYFALLLLITLGVYHSLSTDGVDLATTLILCAGGGMAGGMIS